jgi:branched-chain amino acid transport system permease protein
VTQLVIGGLALGGVYALFALGFALIFGVLRIAQFAHGEVYMMVAFGVLSTIPYVHLGGPLQFFALVVAGLVLGGLVGLAVERVVFRPLAQAPHVASIIGAIGLSIMLQYLAVQIWGPGLVPFSIAWQPGSADVGGAAIPLLKVVILATVAVLLAVLQTLLLRTKVGRAMRAIAIDAEAARLMGIDPGLTAALAFVIASALAGAAGVLVSALYGVTFSSMGVTALVKGYTATVVGGVGNLTGAVVAGLALGLVEVVLTGFIPQQWTDVVIYVLLLVLLAVRPQGLFGRALAEKL